MNIFRKTIWLAGQAVDYAIAAFALALPPIRRSVLTSRQHADENLHQLLAGDVPERLAYLDSPDSESLLGSSRGGEIRRVPGGRIRRIWFIARSEVLASSHVALFGPRAPRNRKFVYLTHGIGPKRTVERGSIYNLFVSDSEIWNDQILKNFGMHRNTRVLRGLPRLRALFGGAVPASSLSALGIANDAMYVIWAPTYRRTNFHEAKDALNKNYEGLSLENDAFIRVIHNELQMQGLQLIIKPHPIEASIYRSLGCTVLTDADLLEKNVRPYAFLGGSAGLISDYSSIWVDYLQCRKPVCFYIPDLHIVRQGRGLLEPNFEALVKSRILQNKTDVIRFAQEVKNRTFDDQLEELSTNIGLRQVSEKDFIDIANTVFRPYERP